MDIRLILKSQGGEVHDSQIKPKLIGLIEFADYLIADKGYDSECIREMARNQQMPLIITRKSNNNKENRKFDPYRLRHSVENIFAHLKHFRGITTRFDKLASSYKTHAMSSVYLYLV